MYTAFEHRQLKSG